MTDIHADGPAEEVTRPADRADIARLDGRIDRSEDRFMQAFAEMRAEFRDGIGKVQASVDKLRKDVQSLNKWKWVAAGVAGLAVVSAPVIAAAILRAWPGG